MIDSVTRGNWNALSGEPAAADAPREHVLPGGDAGRHSPGHRGVAPYDRRTDVSDGVGTNTIRALREPVSCVEIVLPPERIRRRLPGVSWDRRFSRAPWNFWQDGRPTVTPPSSGSPCRHGATVTWGWSAGRRLGVTQYAVAQGAPAALKCLSPAHRVPDRYQHIVLRAAPVRTICAWNWLNNLGVRQPRLRHAGASPVGLLVGGSRLDRIPGDDSCSDVPHGGVVRHCAAGPARRVPASSNIRGASALPGTSTCIMDPLTHSTTTAGTTRCSRIPFED